LEAAQQGDALVTSCFAERFGDFIEITPTERQALARLEERTRPLKRGAVLIRENDSQGELFILTRGTAMTYVLLDDGSRQILRFLFPGDMIGFSSLVYVRSAETIAAVSDCVVAAFDRQLLTRIISDHPRLSALIMTMNQLERIALLDRLVALGRTSAKARVAAILLEIRDSRAVADGWSANSFLLGLTQEEIGDATGLTAVHVNRMLRQLDEEGLIARDNGRVTLVNEVALTRLANYTNRFNGIDLNWLPPGR